MTEADRRRILGVGSDLAAKALRVLAVAQRNQSGLPESLEAQELERELIFVGLIGMMDPPRPEVRVAVERCARGRGPAGDDHRGPQGTLRWPLPGT